jgi:hypothetical protein
LIRASEAKNASYFLASFLTSFLFLLSLAKSCEKDTLFQKKDSLLEIIDRHVLEINLLCTIDISGIGKNADGHARTGNVRKPRMADRQHVAQKRIIGVLLHGARETLVTLWVVVLETNLQFDGLYKVSLFLAICFHQKLFDRAPHT